MKNHYMINFCDKDSIHCLYRDTHASLKIVSVHIDFEVMLLVSWVYFKSSLSRLVTATIFDLASKDKAGTLHEIIHDVFKLWHKLFVINQIKVYFIVRCDIDPDIAFDKVQHTFVMKCFIVSPSVYTSSFILDSLEEKHLRWTSNNQAGFFDKEHCSKILINNLLILDLWFFVLDVVWIKVNTECLSLTVECIYLSLCSIPETLVWEIQHCTVWNLHLVLVEYLFGYRVVQKMVMHEGSIMEEINEEELIIYKSTCDIWIRETIDWHGVVIHIVKSLVHIKSFGKWFFLWPLIFIEGSYLEITVIKESNGIFSSLSILFNIFHLNIAFLRSTISLRHDQLLSDQAELSYKVLSIIFLGDRKHSCGIIGYHHWYDWPGSLNLISLSQFIEYLWIVLPLWKSYFFKSCWGCKVSAIINFNLFIVHAYTTWVLLKLFINRFIITEVFKSSLTILNIALLVLIDWDDPFCVSKLDITIIKDLCISSLFRSLLVLFWEDSAYFLWLQVIFLLLSHSVSHLTPWTASTCISLALVQWCWAFFRQLFKLTTWRLRIKRLNLKLLLKLLFIRGLMQALIVTDLHDFIVLIHDRTSFSCFFLWHFNVGFENVSYYNLNYK